MLLSNEDNNTFDKIEALESKNKIQANKTSSVKNKENKIKKRGKKNTSNLKKKNNNIQKRRQVNKKEIKKIDNESESNIKEIIIFDSEEYENSYEKEVNKIVSEYKKTEISFNNNLTENNNDRINEISTNKQYIIILKLSNFEKKFYMNGDESAFDLYQNIFREEVEGKLYLDDNKISKYLSISENGFVPGVNYIKLADSEKETSSLINKLIIQISDDLNENIEVLIPVEVTISELMIEIGKKLDIYNKFLIFNGVLLSPHLKINDILESGNVLDLVLSEDFLIIQ